MDKHPDTSDTPRQTMHMALWAAIEYLEGPRRSARSWNEVWLPRFKALWTELQPPTETMLRTLRESDTAEPDNTDPSYWVKRFLDWLTAQEPGFCEIDSSHFVALKANQAGLRFPDGADYVLSIDKRPVPQMSPTEQQADYDTRRAVAADGPHHFERRYVMATNKAAADAERENPICGLCKAPKSDARHEAIRVDPIRVSTGFDILNTGDNLPIRVVGWEGSGGYPVCSYGHDHPGGEGLDDCETAFADAKIMAREIAEAAGLTERRPETFYELAASDVGKAAIRAFGRAWPVSNFIGRILPADVGKRVFRRGDILQVENNEQRDARVRLAAKVEATMQAGRDAGLFKASCSICGLEHATDDHDQAWGR